MTHDPSHSHDRKPDAGHAAPSGEELTCREICDFVMAYLDGELSGNERTVFEAHLRLCPQCVSYLDGYKSTIKLAKQ